MKLRLLSLCLCLSLVLGLSLTAYGTDNLADDPDGLITETAEYSGGTEATATQRASTYANFTHRTLKDGEVIRYGIDVSYYQGAIDWKAVAESGVEFAFIRAGFRGYATGSLNIDTYFKTNIQNAIKAGIQVGVYFFSQAITEEEAQEEAEYVLDLVKNYDITMPIVIDFEFVQVDGKYDGRLYNADLTVEEYTAICNAFCDTVEAAGYDAAVYANYYTLRKYLDADQFSKVWLAQYIGTTGYPGAYEFWQCSDGGEIPGINGRVDLDFWYDASGVDNSQSPEPEPDEEEETPDPEPDPEPEPEPEPDYSQVVLPFTDIASTDWYYADLQKAYAQGIIKGMTETTMAPNGSCTRGQVVTMLYRAAKEPDVTFSKEFSDVKDGLYYSAAISWCKQSGIVNGYTNGAFGVNDSMTRQDLVTVLYRMAGSPSVSGTLTGFKDISAISSYAQNAVLWAVQIGLMQGDTNKTLRPKDSISRAEVCTLLMRYQTLVS